jgi:hypothetical protein
LQHTPLKAEMSTYRFKFKTRERFFDFTAGEISGGIYKLKNKIEDKSNGVFEYLVYLNNDFYLCNFSQRKILKIPPCSIEPILTTGRNQ